MNSGEKSERKSIKIDRQGKTAWKISLPISRLHLSMIYPIIFCTYDKTVDIVESYNNLEDKADPTGNYPLSD